MTHEIAIEDTEDSRWRAWARGSDLSARADSRDEALRRPADLLKRAEEMVEALEKASVSTTSLEEAEAIASKLKENSKGRTVAEAARSFRRAMREAGVDFEELTDCSQVRKEMYAERKAREEGEDRSTEEILEEIDS